jgi:hypothetical protein
MAEQQLPENLQRKVMDDMFEVMAYLKTKGDPRVMESFVSPPSLLVLGAITLLLVLIAAGLAAMSNYANVRANWAEYRCEPSVTPFAKFYGFDLEETINFCIGQSVKEHAPGVINPIYAGINKITGVVDGVYTKVEAVEGGVSGLLSGFKTFITNFENSFRLLGTRIRMAFIRIKDIFARVYGIFIAFAYAAISAITFGENLICNPLVTFVAGFAGVDICCFAPDTQIIMADGSTKAIRDVTLGDRLVGDVEVVSTYLFDGAGTRMYKIHGIHVSGNHYVAKADGELVRVDAHPAATPAPELDRLWCLGTSTHIIPIQTPGGRTLVFADYEESSDPAVIAAAQRIAETKLNPHMAPGPTVADYSLGLDPTLSVQMANGTWKPMGTVAIGDRVTSGGQVVGLIRETCESVCLSPGGHMVSAAQLIWMKDRWIRAAHLWPVAEGIEATLYHVMIDNDQPLAICGDGEYFLVRDYAEITDRAIQEPYDAVYGVKN